MDPFKEFRAPKTPLWAKYLGDWRARRRAKKARKTKHHVTTVVLWCYRKAEPDKRLAAYIQLYSTGGGERSYTFEHCEWPKHRSYKDFRDYHEVIIPWLNGKWSNKAIIDWAVKTHKRSAI